MRDHPPVSDRQMSEAVRRGLITADQRDALLALARRDAVPAAHRALAVVLVVAAVAPTFALGDRSHLGDVARAEVAAAALAACAVAGWLVRARGWGRTTAAILTAGAAAYAGGVASFLVAFALRRAGVSRVVAFAEDPTRTPPLAPYVRGLACEIVVMALVTVAIGATLWRRRRNGPALAVVGYVAPFGVAAVALLVWPLASSKAQHGLLAAAAFAGLVVAALRPAWGRRPDVDGAAWFDVGAFSAVAAGAGGVVGDGTAHGVARPVFWVLVALLVGLVGLVTRRWTWQIAGSLGLLSALALGARAPTAAATFGALLGATATLIAVRQWNRPSAAPVSDVTDGLPDRT